MIFLQDIADTFEGNFKEQNGLNSNWLPVNSAQVSIDSNDYESDETWNQSYIF